MHGKLLPIFSFNYCKFFADFLPTFLVHDRRVHMCVPPPYTRVDTQMSAY